MSGKSRRKAPVPQLPMPGLDPLPAPASADPDSSEITWARRRIEAIFHEVLGKSPFTITWTNNIRTFMTCEVQKDGSFQYRMNQAFLFAPRKVIEAAAGYPMRRTKQRQEILHRFMETKNYDYATRRSSRNVQLQPRGDIYDLQLIFEAVNESYFEGQVEAKITWGNRRSTRGKNRISLGSCSLNTGIIRINPVLDSPEVPFYFVEYIVYHEMVHALLQATEENGRQMYHGTAFNQHMDNFAHLRRAEAWEREVLPTVLARWRP